MFGLAVATDRFTVNIKRPRPFAAMGRRLKAIRTVQISITLGAQYKSPAISPSDQTPSV